MAYHLVESILGDKAPPVGKLLGEGFHGQVFEVPGDEDKVIKYSRMLETMSVPPLKEFYNNLTAVLAEQKKNAYPCYVNILDFHFLYEGKHPRHTYQNYILYSVLMEKLIPISFDEKRVFDTIVKGKGTVEELVAGQKDWLIFEPKKVLAFMSQVNSTPIFHNDFNSRNIMKDSEGNFKLIDLDYAEIKRDNNYEVDRFKRTE